MSAIYELLSKQQNFACDQIESIADNKSDVGKIIISVFDRVENTMGKGENDDK